MGKENIKIIIEFFLKSHTIGMHSLNSFYMLLNCKNYTLLVCQNKPFVGIL